MFWIHVVGFGLKVIYLMENMNLFTQIMKIFNLTFVARTDVTTNNKIDADLEDIAFKFLTDIFNLIIFKKIKNPPIKIGGFFFFYK